MTEALKAFYAETDPDARQALLREAELTIQERALLDAIWERRYSDRPKEQCGSDFFIRSYLVLNTYTNMLGCLMRGGRQKVREQIRYDLFLNDIERYPGGMEYLCAEFQNCARLYLALCRSDRAYRSRFWGAVPMKEDHVTQKIQREVTAFSTMVHNLFAEDQGLLAFADAFLNAVDA